jgi:beta-lactamase regulating signal transducer with metallopeptidase domain
MTAADILDGLVRVNLAAGAAIVGVIALRRLVRRPFGARLAYGLWLLPVLAGAAVLAPPRQVVIVREAAAVVRSAPEVHIPIAAQVQVPLEPAAASAFQPTVAASPPAATVRLDPVMLLVGLWLAGAGGAALVMAVLQRRFVRQARRGAVGPAVVGVIAPRIVTPRDFGERYSQGEQALVLAHEQAHIARQDSRLNGLCALVQCLCWFNPLVHLGARLMRIDQELACDEAVVTRFPAARRAYAEVLLKAQMAILPLPLGCYWPSKTRHPLVERVALLKLKGVSPARRWAGGAALTLLCAGAGLAAWASQPADVRIAIARSVRSTEAAKPSPEPAVAPDESGTLTAIRIALNTASSVLDRSTAAPDAAPPSPAQDIPAPAAEPGPLPPTPRTLSPASGQAIRSASQVAPVTVWGTLSAAMVDEQARNFVQSYATAPNPEIDQIGRWHDPVCVQVVGLVPGQAALVKARLESVAQAVGLKSARADCHTNVEIVFTDQPQPMMDLVAGRREYLLGYYHLHDRDRLKKVTRPIQSWYVSSTSSFAGVGAAVNVKGGDYAVLATSLNSAPASKMGIIDDPENGAPVGCGDSPPFTSCYESWIENVLIVADSKALEGRDLGLAADYIAMLALSKPRSQDGCSALASVIDAFAKSACPGRDAPDGLTPADAAYLTALYAADPGVKKAFEKADIARRMAAILTKANVVAR